MADQKIAFKIAAQVTGSEEIKGLTRDVSALRGSAQGIESAFGSAGNAIKGLAAAFGAREIFNFTKGLIDLGDELKATSEKFGISASMLAKFKTSAELSDVSFESLGNGIKKLSVSMVEAATKGGEAAKAFTNIGVSIKNNDGSLKTNAQLLLEIADKFSKTEDGARKAAASVAIFGKAGADLIPFLNQGSEAIQEFGLNIDDDFANKADNFNDNLTKIITSFKNLSISAISDLLPALVSVTDAIANMGSKDGAKGIGIFEKLGDVIKRFSLTVYGASQLVEQAIDLTSYSIALGLEKAKKSYETFFDYVKTGFKEFKAIASLDLDAASNIQSEYRKRESQRNNEYENKKLALGNTLENRMKKSREDVGEFFGNLYGTLQPGAKPSRSAFGAITDESSVKSAAARERETQKTIANLNSQISKENELTEAIYQQIKAHEKSYGYGAQQAIADYVEKASEGGKMMYGVFTQAFAQIEDALTNFVKTGKLNFKELTDFISTELIRISIRQSIISPLLGSLSGFLTGAVGSGGDQVIPDGGLPVNMAANGDVMTSQGPMELKKYSRGGVATSPQLAMFGEGSNPEAYVPLPDGRRIPVNMKGGGVASNNVSVSVNINQSTGESDVQSQTMFGKKIGEAIQRAVKQELVMQLRPGGVLT